MNSIEEQRQIVDQLYQIVRASCPENTETASCRFDYERFDDGSASVGQEFHYTQNGEEFSTALDRQLRIPVMGLVKQLHSKMKAHTGGDWQAFTLTINRDGSVTTRFEYPDQS